MKFNATMITVLGVTQQNHNRFYGVLSSCKLFSLSLLQFHSFWRSISRKCLVIQKATSRWLRICLKMAFLSSKSRRNGIFSINEDNLRPFYRSWACCFFPTYALRISTVIQKLDISHYATSDSLSYFSKTKNVYSIWWLEKKVM